MHTGTAGAALQSLLLLSGLLSASAFLGFDFGYSEESWNVCGAKSHCDCAEDLLTAMAQGLDCSQRHIQHLANNMVVPLRFTSVDLSGNNVSTIRQATFLANNSHVTRLDLAANQLTSLQTDTFANLPSLQTLDLSNNLIMNMTALSLGGLMELQSIDLSYNRIYSLPENFFSEKAKLREILLEYNPIKILSDTIFDGLWSLKHLDLTSLQLTTLHEQTFQNLSIGRLSLMHNDFKLMPTKALYQLASSLNKLDVSGNSFETLPAYSLYNLPHLEELRMEQMIHLTAIHANAFNELVNLKTVVIRYLPRIKFVDERAFVGIVNNTEVRCPVQDFTFSYTTITSLPQGLLDWDQLKYLDLHNNRWKCDCKFSWIKGSAIEKLIGDEIYCSSPPRVRGALLSWLKEDDFVCKMTDSPPGAWEWGTITLICLVGLLASVTTVSVLFYRRNGYLCRPPSDYSKLTAQSRGSLTVLDTTTIDTMTASDAEINTTFPDT